MADSLNYGVADSLPNAFLDPWVYDHDEESDDDEDNANEVPFLLQAVRKDVCGHCCRKEERCLRPMPKGRTQTENTCAAEHAETD